MKITKKRLEAAPACRRQYTIPIRHQPSLSADCIVKKSELKSLPDKENTQVLVVEAMVEAYTCPELKEVTQELADAFRMRQLSEFDNRLVIACMVGFILAWLLEPQHDTIIELLMKNINNMALTEATYRSGIRKRKWRTKKTIWEEVRYA